MRRNPAVSRTGMIRTHGTGQPPICLDISMHIDERFGGLATSLPRFSQAVTQTGRFRSRLVAFCDDDETLPASIDPDAVQRFPSGRLRWATDARVRGELRRLIRDASIVHIHGLWQEHLFVAGRLCQEIRRPYMISAHGMLEPWALERGKWSKKAYLALFEGGVLRGAAGLRALTRSEVGFYRDLGLENRIEVLPNGIDLPEERSPRPFLEGFPELANRRLVLFLGRIHPKKGLDVLFRAWAKVQGRFPDCQLVIAGPDEDGTLGPLTGLVRELGIGARVTFTGILRARMKWSALAAASIFVLPSYSEGFSVAVLEALAAGLPVMISPGCHFREAVEAGCGWEAAPEEKELASMLASALSMDREVLAGMGCTARRFAEANFTWARIGEQAADVMERWAVRQ